MRQSLTSCSTMEPNGAYENILGCVHPQMLGRLKKKKKSLSIELFLCCDNFVTSYSHSVQFQNNEQFCNGK